MPIFIGKMPLSYFKTPESLAGKSLYNIFDEANLAGEYTPRMDVLMNATGLSRDNPLTAGQGFSYNADPGSGEYQFLSKKFGNPISEADKASQDQTAAAQKAVQPAIDTLQSGIDPLKKRYQDLISSIKGKGAEAVRQTEISSAREFGKRGIPLSSGAYDQFVQSQTLPVNTQYAGLEASANLDAQNAEQNIKNAIAQLQGQSGFKGLDQALAYAQLAQNQNQFQTTEQRLRDTLEKSTQKETDPYAQFKTIGEGQTLFDLLSGKSIYTAPKTYKPGGGDDNDPLGINS